MSPDAIVCCSWSVMHVPNHLHLASWSGSCRRTVWIVQRSTASFLVTQLFIGTKTMLAATVFVWFHSLWKQRPFPSTFIAPMSDAVTAPRPQISIPSAFRSYYQTTARIQWQPGAVDLSRNLTRNEPLITRSVLWTSIARQLSWLPYVFNNCGNYLSMSQLLYCVFHWKLFV